MTAIDECWGSGGDRLGLSDDRKESDGGLGKETKERKENRLRTYDSSGVDRRKDCD